MIALQSEHPLSQSSQIRTDKPAAVRVHLVADERQCAGVAAMPLNKRRICAPHHRIVGKTVERAGPFA